LKITKYGRLTSWDDLFCKIGNNKLGFSGELICLKFWLKPFSKGPTEPPRSAVAIRRWRNFFSGVSFLLSFFFAPIVSKKKADDGSRKTLFNKGNPPLVRFPLCQAFGLTFTPSVAL